MERIISVQKTSEEDYIIQFYLCLCKNDGSEIKRLLKHQKNRSYYERMEPLKKEISLDMQAKPAKAMKERDKYRTMDRIKKQLLNKKAEKCRTMDSDKKQQLLNKNEENTEQWTVIRNNNCRTKMPKSTEQWTMIRKKI